jgi:hypothetical protein
MRAHEFITETTTSGSIAPVVAPMGGTQRRNTGSMFAGKYTKEPFANTPQWMRKGKRRAR